MTEPKIIPYPDQAPVISAAEQQKVLTLWNDDSLTDDQKYDQITVLPEPVQAWFDAMIFNAFGDGGLEASNAQLEANAIKQQQSSGN